MHARHARVHFRDHVLRLVDRGPVGIGIRTQTDVSDSWIQGADIATTGLPVIREMSQHPMSTEAIQRFDADFAAWLS